MKRTLTALIICILSQSLFAQLGWQNDNWQVIANGSSGGSTTFNESGTFTVSDLKPNGEFYRADLAILKDVVLSESEPYLFLKIKLTDGVLSQDKALFQLLDLEVNQSGKAEGASISGASSTQFITSENDQTFHHIVWDLSAVLGDDFYEGNVIPFTNLNWTNGSTTPGSKRGIFGFKLIVAPSSEAIPAYEVYKISTYANVEAGLNDTSTASERPVAEDGEYQQIIFYGQSLSMGWEAPQAITTQPIDGNFMLGSSPLMLYSNQSPTLNPLVASRWQHGGEQPVVSCVNAFATRYRDHTNAQTKFIGMQAGEGGRTIERLSKECTNDGFYQSTFLKILDNTLAALEGSNATVQCPAIVYMQGEYNYKEVDASGQGLTPGTNGTTDKDEYKRLLLILKDNMQHDIMSTYGQTEKPIFFIYQTSGKYVSNEEQEISMAQYEFAQENSDVILLNPHYAMPDYNGGHLSTNGYRWYGEIVGNILYDVLVDQKEYKPVIPESFDISENTVAIQFHVPTPPLNFDTLLTPKVSNYGFLVTNKNQSTNLIEKVEIIGESQVKITCTENLSGSIEISYAGKSVTGTGNLADSYSKNALYTYFDDSSNAKKEDYTPKQANGAPLYGESYPLKNWGAAFYHVETVPNNNPTGSILSPKTGSTFLTGDNIKIEADASDPDGHITKVEFFRDNTKIGEDTSAPYTATWLNAPAGDYEISAIIYDNYEGTDTASVIISVKDPTTPLKAQTADQVKVYPNPFFDSLTIQIADLKGQQEYLTIYDAAGKVQHRQKIDSLKINLNMTYLKSGLYFLEVGQHKAAKRMTLIKP
ncbi:Ig-like domain-containing protein [Marinoscillum furvescens]|uniref:Putative secreted protein (Por secretion system target) n=1 Tax=Marinoscillum furvescens DSM 4134 TaxID=1122208 RepID=A0A3D9KZI6_MARFU|nr:Ig-like domain-containing protein [Marinoscillum furvescens]RED95977.1 putative secreted protein (Por secretion system target) [Marinoscillum furvescens DSM 4134]